MRFYQFVSPVYRTVSTNTLSDYHLLKISLRRRAHGMAVFFGFAYGVNTPCLSDEKADEQGVFLCVKRA